MRLPEAHEVPGTRCAPPEGQDWVRPHTWCLAPRVRRRAASGRGASCPEWDTKARDLRAAPGRQRLLWRRVASSRRAALAKSVRPLSNCWQAQGVSDPQVARLIEELEVSGDGVTH